MSCRSELECALLETAVDRNIDTPKHSISEIARNSVESQRPSVLLDYAAAASLATGFRESALVKEASSSET